MADVMNQEQKQAEQALQGKEIATVSDAKSIVVTDMQTMELATISVKAIDALLKEIDSVFDPQIEHFQSIKREAEAGRKTTSEKKAKYQVGPLDAKRYLLKQIGDFRDAENKKREAEARAEQERLRKAEEERRLKEAEALENQGQAEKADEVLSEPITTPKVEPQKIKTEGILSRCVWKFRVTDLSKIPLEYMLPNEVKIGQFVRMTKRAGEVIPGIEAFEERSDFMR